MSTPTTKLRIPAPLRTYTDNLSAVSVVGSTVSAALQGLVKQFPGLRTHLFDDAGELRSFVNLYRNDEDIRYLDNTNTVLRDGDELVIVPSIAGGGGQV